MVGSRGLQFQQLRKWLRTVQTECRASHSLGIKAVDSRLQESRSINRNVQFIDGGGEYSRWLQCEYRCMMLEVSSACSPENYNPPY